MENAKKEVTVTYEEYAISAKGILLSGIGVGFASLGTVVCFNGFQHGDKKVKIAGGLVILIGAILFGVGISKGSVIADKFK